MRHFYNIGDLKETSGFFGLEVFVILYSQSCESLVWYAMALQWSCNGPYDTAKDILQEVR
jgi:hypothetical protein